MKKDFVFTSESLTEGHPDKLCDQISDAIVDHFLHQDPYSRVIAECAVSTAIVFIAARFVSEAVVDFPYIARQVIEEIGYRQHTFNSKTCSIVTSLKEMDRSDYYQFDEKVLTDEEIEGITVKNQATVFGFACRQSPSLIPLPIWLAHKIARRLSTVRREGILPYLSPDGKVQVGIEYRDRKPYRVHSITVTACQNLPDVPTLKALKEDIRGAVIDAVFLEEPIKPDQNSRIFINPEGPMLVGGPSEHAGLTGRKNAIDTYGEYSRHSGAALSGKDPFRIDRIGAYVARYAAKNVVAAGLAQDCEVQLSYSLGLSRPVSVQVETLGTGTLPDAEIATLLERHFDFRIAGIIRAFNLRNLSALNKGIFFRRLAAFGHVGRSDIDLPWEATDKADLLK